MVARQISPFEVNAPDNKIKLINSANFSLLMVYMFIKDHTYMLETPHTSLTLFTSHSVVKCVSPNKDYYYFEYLPIQGSHRSGKIVFPQGQGKVGEF